QGYFRNVTVRPSLDGARLYTTLKPCRMCAGMIQHAGQGKLDVLYGQGDPGGDAQNTVLDGSGRLHALDGSNPTIKPVRTILMGADGIYGKANLLQELEQERERKKAKGTIATTLALQGSRERMRGAVRALELKMFNYSDPGHGKANVRRALDHIDPFLKRHGAHPDQIIDVSEYLYGDADAVPYNLEH
ncbi:MAG TPA: Bd3614 family nucleic acid deaminase, partial [Longimicrobium sp.]|nr:Bd3614 family nucleic acid deaminase [Longimicrobium sp.]